VQFFAVYGNLHVGAFSYLVGEIVGAAVGAAVGGAAVGAAVGVTVGHVPHVTMQSEWIKVPAGMPSNMLLTTESQPPVATAALHVYPTKAKAPFGSSLHGLSGPYRVSGSKWVDTSVGSSVCELLA
jgi:hypothetical protein